MLVCKSNKNEKGFILREGEDVCSKCDGEGRVMDTYPYVTCPKCKGIGITDWITNVVGAPIPKKN